MFADIPSTTTGLFVQLSLVGSTGDRVRRVEVHPAGWGDVLIALVPAEGRAVTTIARHAIGDLHIITIERRPFPTISYQRETYNDTCLMAHQVVIDLLWYLQRMQLHGRPVWEVAQARPLLYDRWLTGQTISLSDFEGR